MTFLWMAIFSAGGHRNSSVWAAAVREKKEMKHEQKRTGLQPFVIILFHLCVYVGVQDVAYHALAAFFYLSAGVALAYITLLKRDSPDSRIYKIDIAAVVRTDFTIIPNVKTPL